MRALLVARPDLRERLGGDGTVVDAIAQRLRAAGVDADLVATSTPDARGYDVAHVFGIFDPDVALPQIAALRAAATPVVVSPIWWDRTSFFVMAPKAARALDDRDAPRARRRLRTLRRDEGRLCRRPGRGAIRHRAAQAAALRACDVALPASEVEAFLCATVLGATTTPYVVARYGMDHAQGGVANTGRRSGVACVGRIEPLKNQAMLLFALRDVDVEVTLVGRCFEPQYLRVCRRWATPRTRFIESLPSNELRALLGSVAVHAMPSWGDLPGFTSLEAAAHGARVVAGTRGTEREYLGPDAAYVDPLDPDGIREAVLGALTSPPRARGDALDARLGALSWDAAARATLDAYARAIAARR